RRARLRLRRLPGGVPVEREVRARGRRRLRATERARGAARRALRARARELQGDDARHRSPARLEARLPPEPRDGDGERLERRGAGSAPCARGERGGRGARARALGSRAARSALGALTAARRLVGAARAHRTARHPVLLEQDLLPRVDGHLAEVVAGVRGALVDAHAEPALRGLEADLAALPGRDEAVRLANLERVVGERLALEGARFERHADARRLDRDRADRVGVERDARLAREEDHAVLAKRAEAVAVMHRVGRDELLPALLGLAPHLDRTGHLVDLAGEDRRLRGLLLGGAGPVLRLLAGPGLRGLLDGLLGALLDRLLGRRRHDLDGH